MVEIAPSKTETPAKTSRAENIFDWLAYGGVAGVGTFIATIPIAYLAKYGKGAKYYTKYSQKLVDIGFKPETAEQIMITNATMQGGNLGAIAVKKIEDNKVALVETIGDFIGEKVDKEALEKEDKQTWSSIIKARAVAWLITFSSIKSAVHILGGETFTKFEEKFAENVVCKPLGKPIRDAVGAETRAFKIGKLSAIDLFATTAATILLYVGSKVFARLERKSESTNTTSADAHATPATMAEIQPERAETKEVPTPEKTVVLPEPKNTVEKILASKRKQESFSASAAQRPTEAAMAMV